MIQPHEKKRFSVDFGDNASILMGFKYVGAQASGTITIGATGDMAFKHGVLSSEVADTTVNAAGDTPGTLDLYGGTLDAFPTYKSIDDCVNLSPNWESRMIGALPDAAPRTTTVGHFTEVTGGACKIYGGYLAKTDDSDSKYIVAGMTWMDDPTMMHYTDHQIAHCLQRIVALSTFTGNSAIKVYACDDDAGTSDVLATFVAGATTVEVDYPDQGYPLPEDAILAQANGKRLVVELKNDTAMSVVRLRAEGYMYVIGPGVRKAAMWSERSC